MQGGTNNGFLGRAPSAGIAGYPQQPSSLLPAIDARTTTPREDVTDTEGTILIAGTRDDWPDGPRTLRPRQATREPNGALCFGAELDDSADQVWFRIDEQSIGRMPDQTPAAKGRRARCCCR